ncbi:MAG: hypothetical protein JRF37_06445 [Deltaproteobacteria bacterium]|nr:hypothetical protein [Deltaproteobacteria bacterium]
MKRDRTFGLLGLLIFLVAFFFVFSITGPLGAAEETSAKDVVTEELPPGAEAEGVSDKWLLIADFSAFYTRSDVSGSGHTDGFSINGLFAPVYKFNDRTFFILMYDGQYYERREYYSNEIGSKERTEFMSHSITPMLRFDFGERARYSLTPSLFHTATYNKDVETNDWDDGLYNYRDYGAGLDFDIREAFSDNGTLSFWLQYYTREYHNYTSLLSQVGYLDLVGVQDAEKDEQDYDGIIASVGYTWTKPFGLSWETEYSILNKDFDDNKVVSSQGTLTGEDREDDLHSLDLNFWYTMDIDGGLKLGVDLNGSKYDSNENFWDERRTDAGAGFDARKFTSDYYDYDLYRIRPNISYTFALFPLTPSISYSYEKKEYDERKAELSDGSYKTDTQEDEREEWTLGLRYDFTDNWAALAQWKYIEQDSNNDDERTYTYDYTTNQFAIGVSFKY